MEEESNSARNSATARGSAKNLEARIPGYSRASRILSEQDEEKVVEVFLKRISPNPWQPRLEMDDEKLVELAASIATHGQLQPVVLRKHNGGFQTVFGHRRIAATGKNEGEKVKAIIKEFSDREMRIFAGIENIQRDELDPFEIAVYIQMLSIDEKMSNKEISKELGVSESYVSRYLGLLDLSEPLREMIKEKTYTNLKVLNALSKIEADQQKNVIDEIISKKMKTDKAIEYISSLKNNGSVTKVKKWDTLVSSKAATVEKKLNEYAIKIDEDKLDDEQKELFNRLLELLQK